jgi:transposase
VPLRVSPKTEKILLARLEAARQLYNACRGEARRRWLLVLQSRAFQRARATPVSTPEQQKARAEAFRQARPAHGLTATELEKYARDIRTSWIGQHIDTVVAQTLADRTFAAMDRLAFGRARRVRFKGRNQMDSLQGKSNQASIRWRSDRIEWMELSVPALIDPHDPVLAHGLVCPVKFVRLVRRKIRGRNRFYAQLVLEGVPHRKVGPDGHPQYPLGSGAIGLDIGTGTVAAVGEHTAILAPFCEELVPRHREIRRLQRRMDRQRRAGNPENYLPDGRIRPGEKVWRHSRGYLKTSARLAELCRQGDAHRKSLHGHLANRILALGNAFRFEQVSVRGWQRRFVRSIGFRAPGTYLWMFCRKAESAGGLTIPFSARARALFQTCHCGCRMHKPLSVGRHYCTACGMNPQRDLYSAFLARLVERVAVEGGKTEYRLNAGQASRAWPAAGPQLHAAFRRMQATTIGRGAGLLPAGLGHCPGTEPVAAEAGATANSVGREPAEGLDVVRGPRGQESQAKVGSASRSNPPLKGWVRIPVPACGRARW